MNRKLDLTVGTAWAALSLIAVAVGSLGPWVTVGPFSVNGTAGDGLVALGAAIVALVALVAPRVPAAVVAIAAAVAAGIGAYDTAAVLAVSGDTFLGSVMPGWGLLLVLVGGISLTAWAFLRLRTTAERQWVLPVLATLAVVGVVGAGVGGAIAGSVDEPEQAETVAADEDEPPAEAAASTEPADAEVEPAAEPKVADLREALELTGNDGLEVRVTATEIASLTPGEYDDVPAGKRMVGVSVRLTNDTTSPAYSDSPSNGAALILESGDQVDPTISFGGCKAQSLKIQPGDSRRVCIPFEIDTDAKLATFQFALDSGFSDDAGEWRLPRTVKAADAAPTPGPADASAEPAGQSAAATTSLTECDQNISAGARTTCGFADEVFKEYARILQAGNDASTTTLEATSPANGQSYSVTCEVDADAVVACTAGDGGYVTFPQWAAEVY